LIIFNIRLCTFDLCTLHYIFTGSGLSALMTVYEMVLSGKFEDKTILLIDENAKKTNDRTWCFWDEKDIFPSIISKKWETSIVCRQRFSTNIRASSLSIQNDKRIGFL
jgi:lycopene beta-cyclase